MSYKVVVLIKPTEEQPALERAAEFARFMPDLQIVAVRVVNEFAEDQKAALEERYLRELTTMKARYPSIEHFSGKVLFSTEIAQAFCEYAGDMAEGFNLAIISANRRNTLKDLFFAPIDSQVMRKIPIPLLIVKDPHAPQRLGRAIVIAMDLEEEHHEVIIDEVLLAAAQIFAENFNGEVHLVNCVPPRHTSVMGGEVAPSKLLDNLKPLTRADAHAAALLDFADKHGVAASQCHVAEGRVDEMIPKLCRRLEARMVCMGTTSRDGILSIIDQSAGELVLEQVMGDIFVVNKHVKLERLKKQA